MLHVTVITAPVPVDATVAAESAELGPAEPVVAVINRHGRTPVGGTALPPRRASGPARGQAPPVACWGWRAGRRNAPGSSRTPLPGWVNIEES